MKFLILHAALTVLCFNALAQTKKTETRVTPAPVSTATLKQQKIWPVNYSALKFKDSFIINTGPTVKTRTRL